MGKVFTPWFREAKMLRQIGRVAELADAKDLGIKKPPFFMASRDCSPHEDHPANCGLEFTF
jgi:hypothetical protein